MSLLWALFPDGDKGRLLVRAVAQAKTVTAEPIQSRLFTLPTPVMPILDVSRCEARVINYETAARMVETYHYAHRVPSIVVAVGMYVDDVLAGCCTFGIPINRNMLACCGEDHIPHGLELNRLFVHDWAGRNSESWLIARGFDAVQRDIRDVRFLVSYADEQHSHIGTIYQATNWLYTGTGNPGGGGLVLIDGEPRHKKSLFDVYGTADILTLEAAGHTIERTNRAPKHRYVYFLGSRRQRKALRKALKWPVLPYPKGAS